MKRYRVLKGPVTIGVGILELDHDQARRRHHTIEKAKGKNRYTIAAPVQFKAGEEFGHEGADLTRLVPLDRLAYADDPETSLHDHKLMERGRRAPPPPIAGTMPDRMDEEDEAAAAESNASDDQDAG